MKSLSAETSRSCLSQQPDKQRHEKLQWRSSAALGMLAVAMCIVAGYFKLFTTWAPYDDEGYVLVTLQHYSQGWKLYDDIFTQYGPAFYQLESLVGTLVPHQLTSDNQRLKTLVMWSVTAAMGGWAIARLVHQAMWGVAGGIILFLHLDRLALEPGHPQMWCALFTSVLIWWLASPTSSKQDFGYWLTAGGLCGLIAMIKPNIGIFALGGISAAIVWQGIDRRCWLGFAADLLFSCLVLAGPWVLFRSVLGTPEAWLVPLVTSVSMLWMRRECLANVNGTVSNQDDWKTPKGLVVFREQRFVVALVGLCAGTIAIAAGSVAIEWGHGVSIASLKRGMIGQHGDLIAQFYHAAPIPTVTWLAAIAILLGWAFATCSSNFQPRLLQLDTLFDIASLMLGGACLWLLLQDVGSLLQHGLAPRGCAGMLAGMGSLISSRWIRMSSEMTVGSIDRAPIVGIAILAPLASFPVPGTQIAVGTIGLGIVVASMAATIVGSYVQKRGASNRQATRLAAWGSMAVAVIAVLPNWHRWSQRQSLGLHGAKLLRLSDDETNCYRQVIASIQSRGASSIVFTWHNRNSFYGWSGLPPISPQSPTFWPYLLSTEQQDRVDRDLHRFELVAVVDEAYRPSFLPPQSNLQRQFWNGVGDRKEVEPYSVGIMQISCEEDRAH